ncbi:MAG: LVIVD repeat-containing protein [Alphaproteobacteria bacterium]
MQSAAGTGETLIWNFRQLAHHSLDGFGGMGEGMSMQLTRDGRRILWMAHESAPMNYTAVDVSDPRTLKIVARAELPHNRMRSNSLETVGDVLAIAYQTQQTGDPQAGFELLDISTPENPKRIAFFDRAGPTSRGVHQLWFADGEYIHMSSGAADSRPTNPKDDQFYQCIDVRNPSQPVEIGRWWLPGTQEGDNVAPPPRHPDGFDSGYRPHNTNVYPQRPDRVYMGYIDGGMIVLDIADKAHPKMVSRWDYHPPNPGFTHTVVPFFERNLLVVSDEATRNDGADWPKLVWIVDNRTEENPVPIATCPLPPVEVFSRRGGRYGAHNLWENLPKEGCWKSETIVLGTFFNGGLRAFDLSNPYQPKEVAYFAPQILNAPTGACQINDVFVDDRGIVFCMDRHIGGLYVLEMDF